MKRLTLILIILIVAVGAIGQTDYSPTILYKEIPYPDTEDTIVRMVKQNIKGWDNKQIKIHLVALEYSDKNDTVPFRTWDYTFHQLMDSTYTHSRDNGTLITNTGRYFVEVTLDRLNGIDWGLWQELGRSIYFQYWDTNEAFIRNE